MSQTNPYHPPSAHVADVLEPVDIDALDVSESWKTKLKWIQRAGGPAMSNVKSMPIAERRKIPQFNILAFLFGPFYYIAKGMWKKGISLFAVCAAVVIVLAFILDSFGYGTLSKSLGYGAAAVFAVRANIDYYKKMVLRDNGWW